MARKVTLIPIAQIMPNADFVSAPSKIRPVIEVSQAEFEANYAETAHTELVSFAEDGVSDPQPTTVFGRVLHYIRSDK